MTVVIFGEGARTSRVRFSVSPLAELGAALHMLTAIDHVGDEWVAGTWATMSDELRGACELFAPLWAGFRAQVLYPTELGVAGDLDAELDGLKRLPIEVFVEQVGYSLCLREDGRNLSELRSDPITQEWLRRHARGRGADAATDLLLTGAEEFRDRLVALLRACWAAFFAASWERIAPQLRGEVAARQALADRVGLLRSLAALSPVATVREGPPRLHLDKIHQGTVNLARTPLLVVPSVFGRPHLLVKHEDGWPAVFHYPIPVAGSAQPIGRDMLRRRLRVLADPTKLRLCRALARHPRSTRELAEWADMTPPDVARHLKVMREAQLVTTRRSGRFVYYTLDYAAVRQLGEQALDVLLR